MMDHFITLGDLLKLGSFLLDLTSVILYIYYNQKIVKSITIKRKRNRKMMSVFQAAYINK